jgi:hypothetical protein
VHYFEGDGPAQFDTEDGVIRAAVRRFLGLDPPRWSEEKVTPGQPGDQPHLGDVPLVPEDADGPGGSVIAEVPAAGMAARARQAPGKCLGCGHARRNHVNGTGLCLVRSCTLCLIFREADHG